MRRTTRKVSGPALGRYLKRFFAAEPGLPVEAAEHLAMRARATFSSIRVRGSALAIPGERAAAAQSLAALSRPAAGGAPSAQRIEGATSPAADDAAARLRVDETPAPAAAPKVGEASFDAFAIGLVPTFQREGRDGLIAKLAAVTSVDHLRKMARAQQIVLPEALRQGDAAADDLRSAIADSVGKRIADRKAAAR